MTSHHKSEDYKLSAVQHYLESDKTQAETCSIFKCSSRSLIRWVDRYQSEKSVSRHNRSPVSYKIKKEHITIILDESRKIKPLQWMTSSS